MTLGDGLFACLSVGDGVYPVALPQGAVLLWHQLTVPAGRRRPPSRHRCVDVTGIEPGEGRSRRLSTARSAAGSIAAAAYELGIGETTVRQHLSGLCRRTGCLNAAQAAYWLATSERNMA
jgi:hypothetical protein